MDWFRWHHGSVNDPKFQLVAKKAGASVGEVIAVWASLLEAASIAADRGNPGDPDFEAMDCALGYEDGKSQRIYERMNDRSLIAEDGRICSWEKRQPKRERLDDDNSTERSRAFRERQRHATPSNAKDDTGTPRGDKSREEDSEAKASDADGVKPAKVTDPVEIIFGYGVPILTAAGSTDKHARSFLAGLRKQHGDESVVSALRECIRAKPLQPVEWLAAALPPPGAKAKAPIKSIRQRDKEAAEDEVRRWTGGLINGPKPDDFNTIDMEASNGSAIAIR